jgi:hypothetical protein
VQKKFCFLYQSRFWRFFVSQIRCWAKYSCLIAEAFLDRRLKQRSFNLEFRREISRLKRLCDNCVHENRPGKRRFAFYDYLFEVYATYVRWREKLSSAEIKRHLFDELDTPLKADMRTFKLMIDASCSADYKTRSRWAQALGYVWRRRKYKTTSREQFDIFLSKKGGVAGCASKIARVRFKPLEGQLGLGFFLRRHIEML